MNKLTPTHGIARPQFGKRGTAIRLVSNYFPLTSFTKNTIFHYDVSLAASAVSGESKRLPPRLMVVLMKALQAQNMSDFKGNPAAFDGVCNMYAAKEIQFGNGAESKTYVVDEPEEHEQNKGRRPRQKTITIKLVNRINPQDLQVYLDGKIAPTPGSMMTIQALNVAIRMQPISTFQFNSRSFFENKQPVNLGGGLEIWRGFYSSTRPCQGGLMLNVDLTSASFIRGGTLINVMQDFLRMRVSDAIRAPNDMDRRMLEKLLKGCRIVVKYNTFIKTHQFRGFGKEPADRHSFELFDRPPKTEADMEEDRKPREEPTPGTGRNITIAEYYRTEKNMNLRYPMLPCVRVSKDVYFPMEFIDVIPGQFFRGKLDPDQTRKTLDFTTKKPDVRMRAVEEGAQLLGLSESPFVKAMGVVVDNKPVQINARRLDPPTILYNDLSRQRTAQPKFSAWNVRDHVMTKGCKIERWSIAVFVREQQYTRQNVERFADTFARHCGQIGVEFAHSRPGILWLNPQANLQDGMRQAGNVAIKSSTVKGGPDLILCILPDKGVDLYTSIKAWGNIQVGVPTQCMLLKNIQKERGIEQYIANVALKINVKLGGTNHVLGPREVPFLSDPQSPAIVFASDVVHPPPGTSRPSISAFVASQDVPASSYFAQTRVQAPGMESITDLEPMVTEAFKTYFKNTKVKPQKILYLRDGVSEGQLNEVIVTEIAAIRRACEQLEANYYPSITAVVVTKRHHTRFCPVDGRDADRSGNAPAGTVVDSVITSPSAFDFYLQSHGGLLGTSRPAHYTVIVDENNQTADEIQHLLFCLTHVYSRATRSVSIPAPVYYADLCCDKSRWHFDASLGDYSDTMSSVSGASGSKNMEDELNRWRAGYQPVSPKLAKSQYFM